MTTSGKSVAVVGSGPAGFMAATRAARLGAVVTWFDKRPAVGRKLLVAGSSGLNITYAAPPEEFSRFYGEAAPKMSEYLARFSPLDWTRFIEEELGIGTFEGTSRRHFIDGMKAPVLLKTWEALLDKLGVRRRLSMELTDFTSDSPGVTLYFSDGTSEQFDAAVLALGGGSWEPKETPLRWLSIFDSHQIARRPFTSSNCGFVVKWPSAFLDEADGKPVKNVVLTSSIGKRIGDLMITRYGVEGTPVYYTGVEGRVSLDLKPDLSLDQVLERLQNGREKLSPIRAAAKRLALSEGALALLFHLMPESDRADMARFAGRIKDFPLTLGARQPLAEAISSSGGVAWKELTDGLELRRFPGIFLSGEMIDWDAPTGGFLIQASVSTGFVAGENAAAHAGV